MDMNHKHIILRLDMLKKPFNTQVEWVDWLRKIIEDIDMKILSGPHVDYCKTEGNEGWSGICMIETSHVSFHMWENEGSPYLNMDLYSCKDFSMAAVLANTLSLEPGSVSWIIIDRNDSEPKIEEKRTLWF